jgi:hypothetical protein
MTLPKIPVARFGTTGITARLSPFDHRLIPPGDAVDLAIFSAGFAGSPRVPMAAAAN